MNLHCKRTAMAVAVSMIGFGAAHAAPIATLDRNGAWVSVEAYGPNVIHVTIAADTAEVLKGPGFGILPKNADNSAFRHSSGKDGDSFASAALNLRVAPAPQPRVPSQMEKYFAPQLAPVVMVANSADAEIPNRTSLPSMFPPG